MKKTIKKVKPPHLPIEALINIQESIQTLKALMKKVKVHKGKPKAQ